MVMKDKILFEIFIIINLYLQIFSFLKLHLHEVKFF